MALTGIGVSLNVSIRNIVMAMPQYKPTTMAKKAGAIQSLRLWLAAAMWLA